MQVLFAVFILFAAGINAKVLPDYVPQCQRKDPEFEKCVLTAVDTLRDRLKTGIPEIGVPALEPFFIPSLRINRNAPSLKIKATLKNMSVHQASNFKIDKFKVNLNKYLGELKITIPSVHVSTDYDIRGSRILILDLDGKGKLNGTFTDIKVHAKGSAKEVEKNGTKFLEIDKIVAKIRIGNGNIAFSDSERPLQATAAQTFFNTSPNTVLDILAPLIEETAINIFTKYLNRIFGSIPLSELLPEE